MQDVVPHGHACNVQTTTRCLSLRNHYLNEKRNLCNNIQLLHKDVGSNISLGSI